MSRYVRFYPALVVAATLLAYLPALRAGWIWDDDAYVTGNQTLRSASGLADIWFRPRATPQYYPVVHTTFWIEYRLFGSAPAGYHAVNVALHAANALLLAVVLARLSVPGARAAALLFALHPIEVESVAWVTERKNCLSALFGLLALAAWIRYRDPAGVAPERAGRPRTLMWAFVSFLLALLSKTVTATLPGVALVVLWWKRGRVSRTDVARLAPFFVAGVALGLVTVVLEKVHVGAEGPEWSLSVPERVLVAGRALWFYVGKLLLPLELTFIYPRWTLEPRSLAAWMYPAAALGAAFLLWWGRKRFGRGPLACALVFAGTLFPALGFFDVYPMRYSFVADHFQYHAGGALLAGLASLLARLGARVTVAAVLGLGLALGAATFRQCATYRDVRTLWRATLDRNPSAWLAHNNLGNLLQSEDRLTEAERHFRAALAVNPRHHEAWNNLGNVLQDTGRGAEAVACYRQALAIRPTFVSAHTNLGTALFEAGDPEAAASEYREALRLEPRHHPARVALVELRRRQGRREEAMAECRAGLSFEPGHARYSYELGRLLAAGGDVAGAIPFLEQAGRRAPEVAEVVLALSSAYVARGAPGDLEQAAAHLAGVAARHPESSEAWSNLAVVERRLGRAVEAQEHFRRALAADPRNADAHANYAVLLMQLDQPAEAASALREAVRLRPDDVQALCDLAWLLASARDPAVFAPAEAVAMARRALRLSGGQDARAREALAVAQAAARGAPLPQRQ